MGSGEVPRIRLLGEVGADEPGGPIDLGGKRQRSVLAILALSAPHPVGVDRIVAGVWGEDPPRSALSTLQSYVSRLRRALGPDTIERSAGGYVLRVPSGHLDLGSCRAQLAGARVAYDAGRLDDAIATVRTVRDLWGATPMTDLADAPFAPSAIVVLSEERAEWVGQLFQWELENGAGATLVADLELELAFDPYREELWRHLIVALFRAQRTADSLRAYERASDALAETGLVPGQALQDITNRVAISDPALARMGELGVVTASQVNPGNVAAPTDGFVGRSELLARLDGLVRPGSFITLHGPGGIGKTRLTREFLARANERFEGGTWLVELAPVTGSHVLAAVADVTGLGEAAVLDAEAIAAALTGQQLVLALDNCEHVADEVALLVEVLARSAVDLSIVATSRVPLGVADEVVVEVDPLVVPEDDDVGIQSPAPEAIDLFELRAGTAAPGFRVMTTNREAVGQIVRRLDGLPLAIEMAAALVGLETPQQIADSLDARFRMVGRGDRPPRHQTLRAMLDWSYELLPSTQQQLFARLSVFADGFDAETAAVVVGEELDARDVADGLDVLRLRSLLVLTETVDLTRYTMLDTMRHYGRDLTRQRGERQWLRERHLTMVRSIVGQIEPQLTSSEQPTAFARLRAERFEIQQALEWALAQEDHESIVEIAATLAPWWHIDQRPQDESLRWALLALEHADRPSVRARLAAGAAHLALGRDLQRSLELAELALGVAASMKPGVSGNDPGDPDADTWASVTATVGEYFTRRGQYERAETHLLDAREWYRDQHDDRGDGLTSLRLFRVMANRAPDLATAEAAAAEFTTLLERAGDLHLLSYAHLARGSMYHLHGRVPEALGAFREARRLSEPLRLGYLESELSSIEAQLELSMGDVDAAAHTIELLRETLTPKTSREDRCALVMLTAELALARDGADTAATELDNLDLVDAELSDPMAIGLATLVALVGAVRGGMPELAVSRARAGVRSRFIVDMLAPVAVFHFGDWLRYLGDTGSGTCVTPQCSCRLC